MQSGIRTHFFLGADSRRGYFSLYGGLLSSATCETQYIIKGGHTYGKSVFLKTLAERLSSMGYDIECYRNTSSPEYLDGIFIPSMKTAFIDGEMPHAVNAQYPGAVETYIDLGALYDSSALKRERDRIIALTGGLEKLRAGLYRYLSAAGEIRDNISAAVGTEKTIETITRRARGMCARELAKNNAGTGPVSYRFLTASSSAAECDYSAITGRCERVCVLDNDFWLSHEMLSVLARGAAVAGYDAVICLDPLEPEKIEHLMIPALSLAFISKKSGCEYKGDIYKHVRLDALPRENLTNSEKIRVKSDRKLFASLIEKADEARAEIKDLTGKLDAVYTPCLDLNGIIKLAGEYSRTFAL